MPAEFQVTSRIATALLMLKLHRRDRMTLVEMKRKKGAAAGKDFTARQFRIPGTDQPGAVECFRLPTPHAPRLVGASRRRILK
jgi:hypothetical protein